MTTPRVTVPVDTFNGDNVALAASISALLEAPDASLSARVPGMAKQLLASAAARLSAAPAPEGGAVDWDAKDQELIERGLRTIRTHDAVRYLREALTATTVRLTGYDWNADPDGVTKQQGDAFAAADRVFADLDAAVASHPEIELPECQTCGGTGKIEEAARMEGANKHSACIRTCDDCDGCGFAPDDEPAALATREEAPAEAGEPCGGCGEADPMKRCVGCLHDFRAQPPAREARDCGNGHQPGCDCDVAEEDVARSKPPVREDAQPVAIDKEIAERLARYLSPLCFENRRRSSRNQHAANKAKTHYRKLAKSILRFPPIKAALTTPPAPDVLRVAVEAYLTAVDDLETPLMSPSLGLHRKEVARQARGKLREVLVALQAEQKGGA